jgi:hypothetical protein
MLNELRGQQRRLKAEGLAPHDPVWQLGVPGKSELGVTTILAGSDMAQDIRQVLFPTTALLAPNQAADVEHLRWHVITGAHAFVTNNTRDFIVQGKQTRLRRHGIWVFTPNEIVELLRGLYRWDA